MVDFRGGVYEGEEPYVFVSYAHADREQVLPLIRGLQDRGLRVWYDVGIEYGADWLNVIVEHLERSACVVCFITPQYASSDNCTRELVFAVDEKYELILCYLEDTTLPAKLRFQTKLSNAVMRKTFASDGDCLDALAGAKLLDPCRMEPEVPEQTPPVSPTPDILWSGDVHTDLTGKEEFLPPETDSFMETIEEESGTDDAEDAFRAGARMFSEGKYAAAMELYREAAEQGHVRAACSLAFCYDRGKGVKADPAEAMKWYRAAAELGDIAAQFHVGYCHEKGKGVEADLAEAVQWYQKAAEGGHTRAACNLAACYAGGKGVEADPARALCWYERAAEQGDAEAQFNTGFCYDKGRGTGPDPEKAVKWYQKAAAQEDPRALFNLGLCYETGRGVGKNPAMAANCYSRAAARDHRAAQYRLSLCYQNGVGLPRDRRKADFWKKKSQEK